MNSSETAGSASSIDGLMSALEQAVSDGDDKEKIETYDALKTVVEEIGDKVLAGSAEYNLALAEGLLRDHEDEIESLRGGGDVNNGADRYITTQALREKIPEIKKEVNKWIQHINNVVGVGGMKTFRDQKQIKQAIINAYDLVNKLNELGIGEEIDYDFITELVNLRLLYEKEYEDTVDVEVKRQKPIETTPLELRGVEQLSDDELKQQLVELEAEMRDEDSENQTSAPSWNNLVGKYQFATLEELIEGKPDVEGLISRGEELLSIFEKLSKQIEGDADKYRGRELPGSKITGGYTNIIRNIGKIIGTNLELLGERKRLWEMHSKLFGEITNILKGVENFLNEDLYSEASSWLEDVFPIIQDLGSQVNGNDTKLETYKHHHGFLEKEYLRLSKVVQEKLSNAGVTAENVAPLEGRVEPDEDEVEPNDDFPNSDEPESSDDVLLNQPNPPNKPPTPPESSPAPEEEPEGENQLIEREKQLFQELYERLWAVKFFQVTNDRDDLTPILNELYAHINELKRLGLNPGEYNDFKLMFYKTKFAITKSSIIRSMEALEFNDDSHTAMDEYQNLVFNPLIDTLKEVISLVPDNEKERFNEDFERFQLIYGDLLTFYMAAKPVKSTALGIVPGTQDSDSYPMKVISTLPVYLNSFSNSRYGRLLKGDYPPIVHEDLNSTELVVNRFLGERVVQVSGLGTTESKEVSVDVKAIPEAMRMFDMFFQGITPKYMDKTLAKSYRDNRRTLYALNGDEIHKLANDYRQALARESYENDFQRAQENNLSLPDRNDPIYTMKIDKKEAMRGWNASIFMMRHFTLAPSSFNKSAPGYYMFNPDYAVGESKGSGKLSPLVYFYFVGLSNPHITANPDGLPFYTLDGLERDRDDVGSYKKGFVEKLIEFTAKTVSPKKLRSKIKSALVEYGIDPDKYWYLFDAPTNVLSPVGKRVSLNEDGWVDKQRWHYQLFSSPLRNMVLRGNDNNPLHADLGGGEEGGLLTFADLTDETSKTKYNPNGFLQYELLDFDGCDDQEQLKWWFNQVNNANNFFANILFASSEDFASKLTTNLLQSLGKDSKYVTSLLEPYSLYLDSRYGDIRGNDVIRMLVMSIAHLKAIQAIFDGQSIHQVTSQISGYQLLHCNEEDLEALKVAVEAGFTVYAGAKEVVAALQEQITESLRFNSNKGV